MEQSFRDIFDSIGSIVGGAKTIFILLDIALFALLIYSLSQLFSYRPKFVYNPAKHKRKRTLRSAIIEERWKEIVKRFDEGTLDAMKFAIIDADGLVDDILKQLGLPGEHFADRLARLTPDEMKSFPRIWRAHRVRNDLVHTPGFGVTPEEAKETLDGYEAFLKELEAI